MVDWTLEKALKVYDDIKRCHKRGEWVENPEWAAEFPAPPNEILYHAVWACASTFLGALVESYEELQVRQRQIKKLNRALLDAYGKDEK